MIRPKNEKHFWILGAVVFGLVTLSTYFPVLSGKVPFPREFVLQFPAWHVPADGWHYADIGDLVTAFYPFRAIASNAVHSGTLPLWNPYFLGGAPFQANPQSSLFYPPNFLYYMLSLPTAWTLCFMLRMFLSGMFMMLFVRSIGASKTGAILSGIVFSLCGFMTAWQGQPMADSATWLPFACYTIFRLRHAPSKFSIAIAACAFAMPVLAGHPETAAHVTSVAIAFALLTFVRPSFDVRFLLRFIIAGILAVGLSAIQLLPTLEWISQLPAALEIRWPPLPLHQAFGWVSRDMLRAQNSAGVWMPEGAAYVGMITFLLAAVGLLYPSRRHVVFFATLVVIGVSLAYGFQPIQWLAWHTPVLSGVKNWRLIFVASFALAALAGLGITVLEETPLPRRRRLLMLVLVVLAFILAFVFYYSLRQTTHLRVEFTRRPSFARAMLFAGLIPLIWRLASQRTSRAFAVLACAVVAFDLVTFSYGVAGFSKREEIFPRASVFQFLEEHNDPGQSRIALLGSPYSINANIMYSIPSADGYEVGMVLPQRLFSLDYTDNLNGIVFNVSHLLSFKDRRLDLLNVKYLTTTSVGSEIELLKNTSRFRLVYNDGHVVVFENLSVLPRAFVVPHHGIEVLKDPDSQLAALHDPAFDPQKTVIVADRPLSLRSLVGPSNPDQPAVNNFVKITQTGVNDLSLRASTSEPAVLVVSQTYYPGWKAIVDGEPAEVFPVNITLTGIALQAGAHDVRLVFDPMSFKVGTAVTLLSLIIAIATAAAVRKSTHDESLVGPNPIQSA